MSTRVKLKKLPQVFHQLFDALNQRRDFVARLAFAEMTDAQKAHAERILLFKKQMFERAVELGPSVWRNWDSLKDRFSYSFEEPNVYASLWVDVQDGRKQKAIGRVVTFASKSYRLNVHHSMMDLTSEKQDAILLHELVHMGYSGHSRDFIRVCREVGGTVSGSGVTEPGVHLEQKQGARYKRIRSFTNGATPRENELRAREWYKAWLVEVERLAKAQGLTDAQWRERREAVVGKWRVIIGT